MAKALDDAIRDFAKIRRGDNIKYPVIVLSTPKGWTGPKMVENKRVENSFRAHQVPVAIDNTHIDNLAILEKWLRSYKPEELFDDDGKLIKRLKDLAPAPSKCMGSSPFANGGLLLKELITPDWEKYALNIETPGTVIAQDTLELGNYIRDLFKLNAKNKNFRIFGPDEALSNRFNHAFEVENRTWDGKILKGDEYLSPTGRIMDSFLSEHVCEGMLEGYLLTGRHGFMHSYEAFTRIIDSMTSQHSKWLKMCSEIKWREDIASLNYLLVSHVFQQDHNGYTHQDPGFLNHVATKKKDIVRIYLPPDTNTLLYTFDHIIKTKNRINVVVASKHERAQWLNKKEAKIHCKKGLGIWDFASDETANPDIIIACAGETPTLEALAAVDILRTSIKNIKIRFINVVDLMKLDNDHPHGLSDEEYDRLFTKDKPIIFNFHGYPSLIKELIYNRENRNISIHGYQEEGTITTPFDIRVQSEIDRFHLVIDAINKMPKYRKNGQVLVDWCNDMLKKHNKHIAEFGEDMPYIKNWVWTGKK